MRSDHILASCRTRESFSLFVVIMELIVIYMLKVSELNVVEAWVVKFELDDAQGLLRRRWTA